MLEANYTPIELKFIHNPEKIRGYFDLSREEKNELYSVYNACWNMKNECWTSLKFQASYKNWEATYGISTKKLDTSRMSAVYNKLDDKNSNLSSVLKNNRFAIEDFITTNENEKLFSS